MEKYFELRENGELLFGIIKNIPDETTIETLKERIETVDDELIIVDYTIEDDVVDVEIDWLVIDNEEGLNEEIIVIHDCLNEAMLQGLESETVFASLNLMKEDSNLTISEAIKKGLNLTIN